MGIVAVSSFVGGAFGPLGMLIGFVVGVVASLVTYLVASYANRDDIFELMVGVLEMREDTINDWPFFGSELSIPLTFQMRGDHGLYEVGYRWRLEMGTQFERLDVEMMQIEA